MGCVYRRGRFWWVKYSRNGRAYCETSGSEKKEDATTLLRLREGDIARGAPVTSKVGRLRFDEARDDFVNERRINGHGSMKKLEARIENHLTPFFGRRRMADITTPLIRTYVAERMTEAIVSKPGHAPKTRPPASHATINRELTILKRMFSLAIEAGKLLQRPYIPMLKEDNVRTGFFEVDAFNAVRRNLPEELRPVVTFAYITGWRVNSEVLPLEWRQVDLKAGEVRLDPGSTKNREGRVFPLTVELRALLEERRRLTTQIEQADRMIIPWVFFRMAANGRRGKKSPKRIRSFGKAWKTACRKAGCPGRIPHDLRRTAVRNIVRASVPERVAMQMTGHKTRSVFERYNIVSEGDLLAAAQRLDAHLESHSG